MGRSSYMRIGQRNYIRDGVAYPAKKFGRVRFPFDVEVQAPVVAPAVEALALVVAWINFNSPCRPHARRECERGGVHVEASDLRHIGHDGKLGTARYECPLAHHTDLTNSQNGAWAGSAAASGRPPWNGLRRVERAVVLSSIAEFESQTSHAPVRSPVESSISPFHFQITLLVGFSESRSSYLNNRNQPPLQKTSVATVDADE
ncbi:hypothetical protein H4582DRAFT_118011 [Lactarius indigo]|nr:hypothetical protein H4582DRAFT_118011 [Lactarius indigo]